MARSTPARRPGRYPSRERAGYERGAGRRRGCRDDPDRGRRGKLYTITATAVDRYTSLWVADAKGTILAKGRVHTGPPLAAPASARRRTGPTSSTSRSASTGS